MCLLDKLLFPRQCCISPLGLVWTCFCHLVLECLSTHPLGVCTGRDASPHRLQEKGKAAGVQGGPLGHCKLPTTRIRRPRALSPRALSPPCYRSHTFVTSSYIRARHGCAQELDQPGEFVALQMFCRQKLHATAQLFNHQVSHGRHHTGRLHVCAMCVNIYMGVSVCFCLFFFLYVMCRFVPFLCIARMSLRPIHARPQVYIAQHLAEDLDYLGNKTMR